MATPESRGRIAAPVRGGGVGLDPSAGRRRPRSWWRTGRGPAWTTRSSPASAGRWGRRGVATMRFNFPYIERGRRSPDPERVLRETWLAAFEAASERGGSAASWPAGNRSAAASPRCAWPTGCRRRGWCSSATRCTRRARPRSCARSTSSGSRSRCCSSRARGIRSRDPDLLEGGAEARLGDRAVLEPVEGGDHSFRIRGVKADDREIGAALAGGGGPFVRRIAGGR